jgi:hypothetical protein
MEKMSEVWRDRLSSVLTAAAAAGVLILIAGVIFMSSGAKACLMPVSIETAFATAVLTALLVAIAIPVIRAWPISSRKTGLETRRQKVRQHGWAAGITLFYLPGMILTQFALWGFFPGAVCAFVGSFYDLPGGRDPVFAAVAASLAISVLGYFGGGTLIRALIWVCLRFDLGTGDEFGDYLLYDRELNAAIKVERGPATQTDSALGGTDKTGRGNE